MSLLYDSHVEGYLEHYGVKGMRWGIRKDQVISFLKSGTPQQQAGKQIVASMLISYGAFKLASLVTRETKYALNKALNKIDPPDPYSSGTLRETGRYYDKKIGQHVYRYD